jgi:hypothetical protein
MPIFNLTDREFRNVLDLGGRGISAAGGFLESRSTSATLDANAQIAALNAREIAETLPIQLEGIESEIVSEGEAAEIQERKTASDIGRARRQEIFGRQSFAAETQLATLTRDEVELRSGISQRLLDVTLETITIRADERVRQLERDRRDRIADIRGAAAGGGVEVTSGSIEAVEEDIREDVGSAVGAIRAEEAVSLQESRIRDELEDSATRERLTGIDERLAQIEIEELQLGAFLEDALFDAALESEINLRNRDINIARLERSGELLRRKAAIGIESFQREEESLEDQQRDQLVSQILSGVGFGVDVLSTFPTLAKGAADLLGIGVGVAGGTGALTGSSAAALGGEASLSAIGVQAPAAGSLITGGSGTAALEGGSALDLLGPGTSAASQFIGGVQSTLGIGGALSPLASGAVIPIAGAQIGSLAGSTTAFAAGTSAATAIGIVAPPIAAILALAAIGGAFSGPGNTPAAREQAGSKVTEILTTANPTAAQLERAKALLGVPNNFSDPNPGTIANFGGVENFINKFGGIDALSPGAREVFQLALDKRTKEHAIREQAASARIGDNTLVTDLRSQGFTAVQAEEILINQIGSGGP